MVADNIYPNSPLTEIVFEIKFNGKLAIECKRDIFYEILEKDYPNILIPKVQMELPYPMVPYRFEKEDKSAGVMIAINRLAYYRIQYEGFQSFKSEVKRIFNEFGNIFKISKINRTGLRYVNLVPFIRENDNVPLERFFNMSLNLADSLPQSNKNINLEFVKKLKTAFINIKFEAVKSLQTNEEALRVDFDYFKEKNLKFDLFKEYLDESHEFIHDLFESLITNEYRSYLMGENI